MALTTLADVRDLIELHLPAEHRARNTWHTLRPCLPARLATRMTPGDAEIAVRMVLAMEGVKCRPG